MIKIYDMAMVLKKLKQKIIFMSYYSGHVYFEGYTDQFLEYAEKNNFVIENIVINNDTLIIYRM